MEIIYNIFNWFVQAIGDILTLIRSIPSYVGNMIDIITAIVPTPIQYVLLLCISAYVIIHIKRLVF